MLTQHLYLTKNSDKANKEFYLNISYLCSKKYKNNGICFRQ